MNKIRVFSVIFLLLVGFVWGETFTWSGAGTDDLWSNEDNWTSNSGAGGYPGENGSDDIVIIDTDAEIELDTATVLELNTLTIGATVSLLFADASIDTLTVDTLVLNGELTIGSVDDGGAPLVASGTINITNLTVGQNGEFSIDTSDGFAGNLLMDGADVTVSTTTVSIIATAIVLTGTVDAEYHTVEITSSSGNVTINGEITAEEVNIDSVGDITISSGITAVGEVKIGSATTGDISINGEIAAEEVNINSVGDITISRDITANGEVNIGSTATGSIIIDGNINAEEVDIENTGNITISGSITANQEVSIGGATTGAINIDGNINAGNVNIESTGNVAISGSITANQEVSIGSTANIAIRIDGEITANRFVIDAPNGYVTIDNGGEITVSHSGSEGADDAAMYVSANGFTATAGEINIVTGGLLLDVTDCTIGTGIINGNYHVHSINYTDNTHLIYSPINPSPASINPYTWIDSSDSSLSTMETYTVTQDYNVYIIDVSDTSQDRELTFEVSGTGFIEITGNYITSASGSLAFNLAGTGNIILSGAGISFGTGDFNANGTTLELTGTNSITAESIILDDVSGAGSLNLMANTGSITFSGDVNVTGNLQATANTGNITFLKTIVAGSLQSETTTGTIYINDKIITTGNQTYNGNVDIGGAVDMELTGSTVTLGMITGNDINLIIDGNAEINGSASTNPIGALSVSGNAVFQTDTLTAASVTVNGDSEINVDITTTGSQTYGGNIILSGTALRELTGTTVTLGMIASSNGTPLTITGDAALNGSDSINSIGALVVTGTASFLTAELTAASVTVTGASTINADITTTGSQIYTDVVAIGGADPRILASGGNQTFAEAVTLSVDTIFQGAGATTDVVFSKTVNGTNSSLTVISANVQFNDEVGPNLTTIDVNGGTAYLNADITTTGDQTYSGDVELGGTAPALRTLTATGATVTLGSAAGGRITGGDIDLTIDGNAVLNGNASADSIGVLVVTGGAFFQTSKLTAVSVTVAETSIINADIETTDDQIYGGNVTIDGIDPRILESGGNQTFAEAVTLNVNTIFQGTGATTDVVFSKTVTGVNSSLTVTNANVQFDDEVGPNLTTISVSGTTTINADITTTGDQTYGGAVTLADDVTLTAATVSFMETLDSDQTPVDLVIEGNAVFAGAVGADEMLASISVSGTTILNIGITTIGEQTYSGNVDIGGAVDMELTGSTVTLGMITGNNINLIIDGNAEMNGSASTNPIGALSVSGAAVFQTDTLTAASVTVNGDSEIKVDITTTGDQTYGGNVILSGATGNILTGTNITLGMMTSNNGTPLTITGNTILNGSASTNPIGALVVSGVAVFQTNTLAAASVTLQSASEINADITTTGNQTYNGNVTLGGAGTRTLKSANDGSVIAATGTAIFTSSGIVSEMNISAGSSILLPNANNIATVSLSATGTTPGNITYNSDLGSGNNLTVTVSSNAISGGSISITEETGNIIIGTTGVQNIAPQEVNLTSVIGSVTINGSIGNSTSITEVVTITSGLNQSIIIDGTIYSYSLSLLADIDDGAVAINAGITVYSPIGNVHDNNSAVYVTTGTFEGSGSINLMQNTAWVCVWVNNNVFFTGNVTDGRIHYHAANERHIVYRTGNNPGGLVSGPYLYLKADDALGSNINFSTVGVGNIYIINVPLGSLNGANTRDVTFSTENGFIEFQGVYYSSGQLNLNPGTGGAGIRLNGTEITLTSTFSNIALANKNITVINDSNITAAGILLDGNVSGGSYNLGLAASSSNITINGAIDDISSLTMTAQNNDININGEINGTAVIDMTASDNIIVNGTIDGSAELSAAASKDININANGVINGITQTLNMDAQNININGEINGTALMEMTATDNIVINRALGSSTSRLGSALLEGNNIQFNASSLYTDDDITLAGSVTIIGTVDIDTFAGNIEFTSVINGTAGGTNTLTLKAESGIILLNDIGDDASRLLQNLKIAGGDVEISSGAAFFMPNGGTVSFDTGASVLSGTLILDGGGSTTPVNLDAASTGVTFGSVSIAAGSNITVTANSSASQTDGSILTIGDSAVFDITSAASSWSVGSTAPNFNFTGNNGSLVLDANARLITHNLNFNDNSFVVNNSGSSYITVTGNADISAAALEGGDYKNLFFEMNGAAQTLNAARSLSRLHVKTTSRTTLANNLQIDGEVVIEYPGVLDAGSYNVTLAAILEDTKVDALTGATFDVTVGRWRVNNAPEDISGGGTNHIMRAFLQDEGGTVEFIKHPADLSGNQVFFEIIGNTVWQTFFSREPGITFQFSTHEESGIALHHHVFLYRFDVQVPDIAANDNNYITLTRLTTPTEPYYFYEEAGPNPYKPPGSTASGTVQSSLPTVPASSSLKADNNPAELGKFWNFNLIGRETESLQIKHVAIFFSHAWYQRVPIASTQMDLRAIPFYRADDNRGHFNYDWVEVRRIIYSYVEDSNGNGKADRIRVQSNVNINGQFSNFNVAIEGFELDRSKGDNGFSVVHGITGDNDDLSSFYIYLKEGADLYDGKPLKWWVTQNGSLYDSISQQLPVGDPDDDENYYTINTIPPRVSYTLALPGHDETYIRFSQPVSLFDSVTETYVNGSNVFISGRVTGVIDERTAPSAPYEFVLEYRQDIYDDVQYKLKDDRTPPSSGAISYLVRLNGKPATADLAALPEIGNSIADWYFELDNLRDMGVRALDWNDNLIDEDMFMYFPSPRYPIDWNYSSYATYTGNSHAQKPDSSSLNADSSSNSHTRDVDIFLPPNRVLTPEMVQRLENRITVTPDQFISDDNRRRITDVLISRPPEKTGDDNYFAWPVWVMQDADNTNITLSDDFVFDDLYIELSDVLKSDTDIIWNFDGSRNLELRDGYKIKMQTRINNDLSGNLNLFYSLNVPTEYRNPVGNSPSGRIMGSLWLPGAREKNPLFYFVPWMNPNFTDLPSSSATTSLFNFDITGIGVSGQRFEFLFKFDNSANNLYITRLEAPAGTVPQNWYELVRPFGFDIQDIIRQRGGVTILNNVINSNNREVTYLRYNLARAGRVTIQVYTLDGTLVKSLRRNEHRDVGEWTDGWDGTNNGGRPVARGMYFIRIVAPDIDEIRKVMVVR